MAKQLDPCPNRVSLGCMCKLPVVRVEGREGVLVEPFCGSHGDIRVLVECDFRTDFASVPRVLWSLFPPWGVYAPAAIVHDWCYRQGLAYIENRRPICVTRHQADKLFYRLMRVSGVSLFTAQAFYWAVRLGAGPTWDSYRKEG